MRICDIPGCGQPAKEIMVDVGIATPTEVGSSEIEAVRYDMDLCEHHEMALHEAIRAFEPKRE